MSQRMEPVMQRILIGLAFLVGLEMAVLIPQAEATSLFDLKKEQYDAENERNKLQRELRQLESRRLEITQGLTTDRSTLTALQAEKTAKEAELNSAWVESTKERLRTELQAIQNNITATQTRISEAEEMLRKIADLPNKIAELERKITDLENRSSVPQQRFSSFMNCYQLALSMKVFNKYAQGQAGVGHTNMEDNIRNVMWDKYQKVYIKYYKTDLDDTTYSNLEQSARKSLLDVGAQFFSGDRMTMSGGLRNQYSSLINSGEPVSHMCDAMREVVNNGERVFWADNASMTRPLFTRPDVPEIAVPGLPPRSIVLPE